MATNKENLEMWLLIDALMESDKSEKIKEIAKTMIRELKTKPDSD